MSKEKGEALFGTFRDARYQCGFNHHAVTLTLDTMLRKLDSLAAAAAENNMEKIKALLAAEVAPEPVPEPVPEPTPEPIKDVE